MHTDLCNKLNFSIQVELKLNVGIQFNDDGTANTEWLKLYTKYVAYHKRLVRIDETEKDLL